MLFPWNFLHRFSKHQEIRLLTENSESVPPAVEKKNIPKMQGEFSDAGKDGFALPPDTKDGKFIFLLKSQLAKGFSGQNYFPEEFRQRPTFYAPSERGFEREIAKRLAYWQKLRDRK